MNKHLNFDGYNVTFFKHLDTPTMLFIFESDEFLIGIVTYLSTMVIAAIFDIVLPGGVLFYAVLSIAVMLGYIEFKKRKPSGYLMNKLYRLGLLDIPTIRYKIKVTNQEKNFKVLPMGFLKEFRGN